jgi:Rrf2 family protein
MINTPLRTLLKREESYAIHALIFIHDHPGTHAAEVAERLKLPAAFMAKVLRKLVKADYIESQMGRNGGVRLLIDLDGVSLLDVVEAISGPLVMDTCQTKVRCATQERKGHCQLKVTWLNTTLAIRDILGNVKLGQLVERPGVAV